MKNCCISIAVAMQSFSKPLMYIRTVPALLSFVMVWYQWIVSISVKATSWETRTSLSNRYLCAGETILKNMNKQGSWIHQNKSKQNKPCAYSVGCSLCTRVQFMHRLGDKVSIKYSTFIVARHMQNFIRKRLFRSRGLCKICTWFCFIEIWYQSFHSRFSIAIQFRWKFRFTLTSILIQWSLQFSTWHDNCTVVACAKMGGDLVARAKFPLNLNCRQKNREWVQVANLSYRFIQICRD